MSSALTQDQPHSRLDQFLINLGIRPREQVLVRLLFSNMFLSGLAIGMIRVCAFTMFLEYFASEQLALVAILLAITGTLVTLIIERTTRHFSARTYIFTVLGTILTGLLLFRGALGIAPSEGLIFVLPLFFEVVYMLFNLQFIALLARLLNVRQTKRLSGLTRSGEFLAEMVGGLSIVLLLNYISVADLLLVAAIATGGVFYTVHVTVSRFSRRLNVATEPSEAEAHGRMSTMIKLPYVRLIAFCYAAYIFAYFFLDVAFYKYAAVAFPSETELAAFIGQFFAISGFLTMFVMVFIFAPFIRRFGMLAGVLAFPILIGAGSIAVSAMEFSEMDAALIFLVMIATNGMRVILQSAIWRPSYAILFQVLPDKQRTSGTALIEGIVDPLAGGLAGVALYFISEYLNWEPKMFLLLLAGLMGTWIICAFLIRRSYLENLVVSIQKRKLGRLNINELDTASLNIIMKGLNSAYPAEIFYCLNILEEIEHPDINNHMQYILANKNEEVRMDVLKRVERLQISKLSPQINLRIHDESNPELLGQVLRTYAALAQEDTFEKLAPFLDHESPVVRKGALIGILSSNPSAESSQDYLLRMIRSENPEQRIFAAEVIGEIGAKAFSGFLVELLDDLDTNVVDKAVVAAGSIRDERLVNRLVSRLYDPVLLGRVGASLQQFGELALYDLDIGLTAPTATRQVKHKIIEIIREIPSGKAIEVLLHHLEIPEPELRHQLYLSLANLHYQADPDDRYIFVNLLDAEVEKVVWLMAAMEDLVATPVFEEIHAAMNSEMEVHRDNMMLLTSFIFSSVVMLDSRANLESKISENRVFALEVLDNVLSAEVKQIVIPLLDELTVHERLDKLAARFPQQRLSAEERFEDIIESHFDEAFFWTRAMMLHYVGINRMHQHEAVIRSCLNDSEPLVRETAIWALAQLSPDDIRRTLVAHSDDASESVRDVVHKLIEKLA